MTVRVQISPLTSYSTAALVEVGLDMLLIGRAPLKVRTTPTVPSSVLLATLPLDLYISSVIRVRRDV